MPELWETVESFRGELIKNIWEDIINQGKEEGFIIDKPNDIIITVILRICKKYNKSNLFTSS